MTTALTPAQTLGMLSALSTDIRAAAVLDRDGQVLAGAPDLAPVEGPDTVVAGDADHTIVVKLAPRAPRAVLAIDLQTALDAMSPSR